MDRNAEDVSWRRASTHDVTDLLANCGRHA